MNIDALLDKKNCLRLGEVDPLQLHAWEKIEYIFKIMIDGEAHYPRYQFDGNLQPLPVIKTIIAAFKEKDSFALAAWFHYPNGWITIDGWHPVAPRFALCHPDLVVAAVKRRRGTYIA